MSESNRYDSDSVPLRAVQNPVRIIAFGVVILVLLAAAFIAGGLIRSPQDEALTNIDADVAVLAQVEERVVDDGYKLPASLAPAQTVDVFVTEVSEQAPDSALPPSSDVSQPPSTSPTGPPQTRVERVVLSRASVQAGSALPYGTLIGEVSGRPVFAWPADVPVFRNLIVGDEGADVQAVQQTLVDLGQSDVVVDGIFGRESLSALRQLYSGVGYALPNVQSGVQGFAWREFVPIPTDTGAVDWVAPVGSVLSAEAPVLRLRVSNPTLYAQASAVEIDQLEPGAEVRVIVANGAPQKSTVIEVGGFATDEETGASGYPVTVAIPENMIVDGTSPIQIQAWSQALPGPAVPAVAVRQDNGSAYVLVPKLTSSDDANAFDRVDIVAIGQADGWVGIEPLEELPVGTEVLVSG